MLKKKMKKILQGQKNLKKIIADKKNVDKKNVSWV